MLNLTREEQVNRIVDKLIELSDKISRCQDAQAKHQEDPQKE